MSDPRIMPGTVPPFAITTRDSSRYTVGEPVTIANGFFKSATKHVIVAIPDDTTLLVTEAVPHATELRWRVVEKPPD